MFEQVYEEEKAKKKPPEANENGSDLNKEQTNEPPTISKSQSFRKRIAVEKEHSETGASYKGSRVEKAEGKRSALAPSLPLKAKSFQRKRPTISKKPEKESKDAEEKENSESVVLEEDLPEDYEPTEEEVLEYAKWL